MADTIADKIEEQALAGVQSASSDGVSVQATPIKDLIEADRYTKGKTGAAAGVPWGIRLGTIVSQGGP